MIARKTNAPLTLGCSLLALVSREWAWRQLALWNFEHRFNRLLEAFEGFGPLIHLWMWTWFFYISYRKGSALGSGKDFGMPVGRFLGSVLPLTARVSIPEIPSATCYPEGGLVLNLDISITNSIVEVDCAMSHQLDDVTFPYAHVKALDLARAAVDLVAFGTGWGLSVHFHTFVAPGRPRKHLLPSHEGLSNFCTVYKPSLSQPKTDTDFQQTLLLVFEEPPLYLALHDLTQAITESHHAQVNCARAIEGLRTMMEPGEPRAKQWAGLRNNLNVQEGYVRLITDQSVPARHGDRAFVHGSLVKEVVERSWTLMNRFLEFRKRGNQSLPIAEFPSLAETRS